METAVRILVAAALSAASLFAQKFEFAEVRVSPKTSGTQFMRMMQPGNGRWEIERASIVDLVHTAWGIDADRVLGGPSWVEMDRFDIVAKLPQQTDPEARNAMLKALLADRFKLVVREEKAPMPGYALTMGKKPSMKEGDGSGDTGCRIQQRDGAPQTGGIMLMMGNGSGAPTRISLGPDGVIDYVCRNMTLDSFVQGLGRMPGAGVGNKPVVNQTGLEGRWDFHLRLTVLLNGATPNGAERVTLQDAVEKQMGLKLASISVPMPVVRIDSVERKPSPDPPGTAEALQPVKTPTVFDVATIRPSDPDERGGMMTSNANRFTARNIPLRSLVIQAFRNSRVLMFNGDTLVGLPKFAETARFDVMATSSTGSMANFLATAPMVRALLEDRFKLKWHNEERPLNAYSLVAVKPKMKRADPASRSHCIHNYAPAGSPPGSEVLTCQNISMDDLVDELLGTSPEIGWPVENSTGLEGAWDFTLTYGRGPGFTGAAPPPPPPGGGASVASDPGGTLTIFEAIEKQLGLKLEARKRPEPVIVIDHLEEKPTEN